MLLKRREFLRLAGVSGFLFSGICNGAVAGKRKPNIVLILVDDLGWNDIGCYGSSFYDTPNIDRLAKEGARFTNAYATYAFCAPSRAGILTGRYQQRFGFDGNVHFSKLGLPLSQKTIATTLKHYQ